jgi:hypothetical protein
VRWTDSRWLCNRLGWVLLEYRGSGRDGIVLWPHFLFGGIWRKLFIGLRILLWSARVLVGLVLWSARVLLRRIWVFFRRIIGLFVWNGSLGSLQSAMRSRFGAHGG